MRLYDQRGTGESPAPPDGDFGLSAQIEDLTTVAAGARSVVVVGGSWGGLIAVAYALRKPKTLVGVVLINPIAMTWEGARAGNPMFAERVAWLRALGSIPSRRPGEEPCDVLVRTYPAYFFDPDRAPAITDRFECNSETMQATMAAVRDYDLVSTGLKIDVPVLLVRGEAETQIFGERALEDVRVLVPPAQLTYRELAGCGHAILAECPDTLVAEISAWADAIGL